MYRIRITQPGFETYTGEMGGIEFENGISREVVPFRAGGKVASLLQTETVDADGNAGPSMSPADTMQKTMREDAPVVEPLEQVSEDDLHKEHAVYKRKAAVEKAETDLISKIYTKDELEAIASADGIKGLRVIGDPYSVKGRSINELIAEILKAQSKLIAKREAEAKARETHREPLEGEKQFVEDDLSEVAPETTIDAIITGTLTADQIKNADQIVSGDVKLEEKSVSDEGVSNAIGSNFENTTA